MQHVRTPRRRPRGLPAVLMGYRHDVAAAAMLMAVIGLFLVYVLLLGDSPPEPVASSWSQAPTP